MNYPNEKKTAISTRKRRTQPVCQILHQELNITANLKIRSTLPNNNKKKWARSSARQSTRLLTYASNCR